jgi:ATP-dependent helicase HrpA
VVIVAGETGSGKTTQLPLICLEAGRGVAGKIGCTQPRRIAAVSIANRVCQELRCGMGREVGYKIRFGDRDTPETCIKFMTDGILLAELEREPRLSMYDTLIIDEAHERSLNIDFILGYLRKLLQSRPDLKVIISSATIDTSLFSKAFNNAPVIEVSGRMFPVETLYCTEDNDDDEDVSYVDAAVRAAEDLLDLYPDGDMLIFMPTERDIRETCNKLRGKKRPNTITLPLFSRLSRQEQELIFNEIPQRKIVVATNIAETSITVPGIRFVVDTGLARISRYVPRLRTSRLPVEAISKAAANQRMGRCGRVMDGVCIRLFSAKEFASRDPYTQPEIRRSNLAGVILSMIAHNLGTIETFAFLEPPTAAAIAEGYVLLRELGAIDVDNRLTHLGWQMSRLPLDPHIARMVIAAHRENALHEVTVIAAALSIVDPRERPFEKQAEADEMHKRFTVPGSDLLSFVKLWDAYAEEWGTLKTQNKMRRFCKDHFLSYSRMQEWHDVHRQISEAAVRLKGFVKNTVPAPFDAVHRSLLTGLLSNCAHRNEQGRYRASRGRELLIFPGSAVYGQKPEWIVCHEIIETSQLFAHTVTPIDPAWLEEIASHLCTRNYSEPWFNADTGVVCATERVSLFGLEIVEHTGISFAKINMEKATEVFIRQGLVEELLQQELHFYICNKNLRREIESLEAKLRTRSLFAGENAVFEFYRKRLSGAGSVHDLNRVIKEQGGDAFLIMKKEDLLAMDVPETAVSFPDTIAVGNKSFNLQYAFEPGNENDGITLKVRRNETSFISESSLGYLVPALWPEKIAGLFRALPKELRKKLLPIDEKAGELAKMITVSVEPFETNLSRALHKRYGIVIDPSLFREAHLPDHLSMRLEICDADGKTVASGRGGALLKQSLSEKPVSGGEWSDAFREHERHGLTKWEIGDLPEYVTVKSSGKGIPLFGYPALVDNDTTVNLQFFPTAETALHAHRTGVKKLLEIICSPEFAWIERDVRLTPQLKLHCMPFGGSDAVRSRVLVSIRESLLSYPQPHPRTKEQFEAIAAAVREQAKKIGCEALFLLKKTFTLYNENIIKIGKMKEDRFALLKKELAADLHAYIVAIDKCVPFSRFRQYPRYLKAFGYRIDRAFLEPVKYGRNRALLAGYENKFAVQMEKQLDDGTAREIETYRQMVEEFAISLFAQQEVKTLFAVSVQRLDKKVGEVERLLGEAEKG